MKRRSFECIALIVSLLLSLLSVSAFAAAPDEGKPSLQMENVIINEFDSILYNDGDTVINNFGTVYNNGGIVYNNGGTVYNNEGTVYNNGGIVFNNGAQVYNNGGTVHNNNGGKVYESRPYSEADESAESAEEPAIIENTEAEALSESAEDKEGLFAVHMTADYSALAHIDGLLVQPDGSYAITKDGRAVIRAKSGVVLTDAITTAGNCTMGSEGEIVLSNVDRDGTLTLKFKLDAPEANLLPGSYSGDQHLTLTAPAQGAKILYTLDGTSPVDRGIEYKKPIEIKRSVTVKAAVVIDSAVRSDVVELVYLFPQLIEPEFDDVKEGYKSIAPQPIVLVNPGVGTVKVKSVSLQGIGKDCFKLNTTKGGSVASGQKDSKTWSIAPIDGLKAGEYEANIVFTMDSGALLVEDVSIDVTR